MTAPVTLITGMPGNGKTLYALTEIKKYAEKENRQVYYDGIEILDPVALPWQKINAQDWHKCPPGAIIVLDEAHKVFPLRPTGSHVPAHVLPIAELRHQGLNLFLITQHPMEIDSAVRRRVGRHLHVVRRFGLQAAAIREWPRCVENCDKTTKDAQTHEWPYNKAAYAWYKSAELHTVKARLPARLLWLVVAALVIPLSIAYMVHWVKERKEHPLGEQFAAASATSASGVAVNQHAGPLTQAEYLNQYRPRVAGLAYTAPAYDEVTKPAHAPYPAACVASASRCQCYTQQSTRLEVPEQLCRGIAAGGFFMAWDEKTQREEPRAKPAPPAASAPLEGGQFISIDSRPNHEIDARNADTATGAGMARAKGQNGSRPINLGDGNG